VCLEVLEDAVEEGDAFDAIVLVIQHDPIA
jgi:hypothetical protein